MEWVYLRVPAKVRSLSRLRERVGVRVSQQRESHSGESPHPRLRRDLPRKRERLRGARGSISQDQLRSQGFDGVRTSGGLGLGFAGGGPGAGLTSIGGGNGAICWLA